MMSCVKVNGELLEVGYRSSVSLLHFLHVASKCSGVSDGQVSVIV